MITHCNETISGLDTIRAFGKQNWFMSEMINRIDNHTKVFLIISSSNRWLGIALVSGEHDREIHFYYYSSSPPRARHPAVRDLRI